MSFEAANPTGLLHQRVDARGALVVGRLDGRTRIRRLFQEGAAKIRQPRADAGPLQAVLINTAGGLTGGDRVAWSIEVGDGAAAVVTTQACERIYRSGGGEARSAVTVKAGEGARLAWLPQETILFDASAFSRSIDAELARDAEGLFVEATLFGRRAMGEAVSRGLFRDRWRIRHGGRLVHAEDFAIGPDIADLLARRAVTGGAAAAATVLLVADGAERFLDDARAIVGERGGASAWSVGDTGKFLARLVDEDGYRLRKRLVPLIELLNGRAGLPKIWST